MLLGLVFAAGIAVTPPTPASVELSPQTRVLIAPVHEAIVRARAELDALPPPKDDTERLLRMQRLDQAPRKVIQIDFSKTPPAEKAAAQAAIWAEIKPIDEANLKALLAMLPPEGWFTISKYGKAGSNVAFLIVQHSDISQWSRFAPVLEKLAAQGEVRGGDYALMYDRLALHDGRLQRYGSQMVCQAGKYVPDRLEDPDHLDERRAALGMTPYKDYFALFANDPPC
ncbi:MAG TPA: DUF6624 domain-containing protein [Phenylobacterium sp.]|jgi:hypothetical protein|nr:DUF6624 domain-containing protein [Phenylobacterium sp.]